MKTTVEISDPLFEQVKKVAASNGLSFRVLVEEGLRTVVEARSRSTRKPFRLRDGSFGKGSKLKPGVDWSQLTALAYENEGDSIRQ